MQASANAAKGLNVPLVWFRSTSRQLYHQSPMLGTSPSKQGNQVDGR